MTSKEALKRITFEAKMEKPIFSLYYQEYIKPIENDLEVLEIIKNKQVDIKDIIDIVDNFELYHAHCIGKGYADEYICNKEEFEKVSRWLNNGK